MLGDRRRRLSRQGVFGARRRLPLLRLLQRHDLGDRRGRRRDSRSFDRGTDPPVDQLVRRGRGRRDLRRRPRRGAAAGRRGAALTAASEAGHDQEAAASVRRSGGREAGCVGRIGRR